MNAAPGRVIGSGQFYARPLGIAAIKHGGAADDLHHVRALELAGQATGRIPGRGRRILQNSDFHELARIEGVTRRGNRGVVDAFLADVEQRFQ